MILVKRKAQKEVQEFRRGTAPKSVPFCLKYFFGVIDKEYLYTGYSII